MLRGVKSLLINLLLVLMKADGSRVFDRSIGIGALFVIFSLISQNLGSGFAKYLFATVGPAGVTSIRLVMAAGLLMLLRKPGKPASPRGHFGKLLFYGASLGIMNFTIYQAFARIPLGVAVAIEVTGPLAIVLLNSRKIQDFIWLIAAVTGLVLLLPLKIESRLDPIGVIFAFAAAISWALYIVSGKKLSGAGLGRDTVTWGMLFACLFAVPVGVIEQGRALLAPNVLLAGLGVAFLASVVPYTLEMSALRKLPSSLFGILLSTAPAWAALAGYFVVGERLSSIQWVAIALIIFASGGSAVSSAATAKKQGVSSESDDLIEAEIAP